MWPNWVGYNTINNVRDVAHTFGYVKSFKVYVDLSQQSLSENFRSEFRSSGVSLIDCPGNGAGKISKMILGEPTYFSQ